MGIKHATSKIHGDKGLASEWNDDHVVDDDVDFSQHQILKLTIENLAAAPPAPEVGQIYYDTVDLIIKVWDGTAWRDATQLREHDHSSAIEGGLIGQAPIGSIISWLKSFTGVPALPDNYLECNGQVVNDAASLLDGETLPDLNGDNRFLRGNATSGATGGAETMAHTHTFNHKHKTTMGESTTSKLRHDNFEPWGTAGSATVYWKEVTPDASVSANRAYALTDNPESSTTSGASNTENRPPFYNVVWVIRIK